MGERARGVFILPFPPGGGTDILGRSIAKWGKVVREAGPKAD